MIASVIFTMPALIASAVTAVVLLSLVLNRLMIALAPRLGLVDQPDARRVHRTPVPRAGGIAIWLSFLCVLHAAAWLTPADGVQVPPRLLWGLTFSSVVLVVVGVLDDRFGIRAWWKLGGQLAAVAVFWIFQPLPNGMLFGLQVSPWIELAAMAAWAVLLINAFNLIDGLDGLCGGLGLVSVLALGMLALANGHIAESMIMFIFAGALLGFLRYNLNPARIFMGDTGSMLVGFVIALAATEATGRRAVVGSLMLPIAVAGVPLLDVLLAVWRRTSRRLLASWSGTAGSGGLFDADKDHLHHRLLAGGIPHRRVSTLLHLSAVALATLAFLPMFFGEKVLGAAVVGLLVVALMGMRHFARVELVHTGSLLHLGIKSPSRLRRMRLLSGIYDIAALAVAIALAILIETNFGMRGLIAMETLAITAILWMIVMTIALRLANTYRRVWSRASLRDLIVLGCWLGMGGGVVITGLFLLQGDINWQALRLGGLATAIAIAALVVPRSLPELLRDLAMDAAHRGLAPRHLLTQGGNSNADGSLTAPLTVFVIGAGDLGNLFLDYLKDCAPGEARTYRVAGFLDDSPALEGRILRGFHIYGGLDDLEETALKYRADAIVIATSSLKGPRMDAMLETASRLGLQVFTWGGNLSPRPLDQADPPRQAE